MCLLVLTGWNHDNPSPTQLENNHHPPPGEDRSLPFPGHGRRAYGDPLLTPCRGLPKASTPGFWDWQLPVPHLCPRYEGNAKKNLNFSQSPTNEAGYFILMKQPIRALSGKRRGGDRPEVVVVRAARRFKKTPFLPAEDPPT